ncbi:MAG: MBL fold metallo-hydrolase [Thermoguttaceae bacterium]|nr:MBL fold metallo-hydrolase [Thermoguttaceae bacterium]MBQ6619224.1 MBL fold metallo-hydrolase [Thermoguttaceae bacterium]
MKRRTFLMTMTAAAAAPLFAQNAQLPAMILWQLPNQTATQMMSYILLCDDDSLIVVDGGMPGDADYLVEMIRKIHPDGHVNAWYLSHPHIDHFGALSQILQDEQKRSLVMIDKLYYNFPERPWFVERASEGEVDEFDFWEKSEPWRPEHIVPAPGEKHTYGSVTIETLNDYDPDNRANVVNNASIVYRVETPNTSILFLGDLGVEGGERLLTLVPDEKLKADYVQMAHHGQRGVNEQFYGHVRPTACLWPTPDWLWSNRDGQGHYDTLNVRAWMDKLGVKENYVMKDGLHKFELK